MNSEQETKNVINWVREYVENSGAKGVVVGNSGGKDSATVIAIASKALGEENVVAAILPCHSNMNDVEDAELVAKTFKVKSVNINLDNSYEAMKKNIEDELGINISKEASINMKPRLRMTCLYSIAATLGYLVIGTGNLSEKTVGYTTKWGDNASDFNPIANFTKEEVVEIGKYLGVPDKIMDKPPSDGLGKETDEDKMGVKYSEISEYILTGKTNDIALEKIIKLNKLSEHKRNQIPSYVPNRGSYGKS